MPMDREDQATVAWLIKTYLARREVAAMLEGEADEYQVNRYGMAGRRLVPEELSIELAGSALLEFERGKHA